jgi:hypothetical protein
LVHRSYVAMMLKKKTFELVFKCSCRYKILKSVFKDFEFGKKCGGELKLFLISVCNCAKKKLYLNTNEDHAHSSMLVDQKPQVLEGIDHLEIFLPAFPRHSKQML